MVKLAYKKVEISAKTVEELPADAVNAFREGKLLMRA
jgi:hypothetical protein